jgi:hypothetical protein
MDQVKVESLNANVQDKARGVMVWTVGLVLLCSQVMGLLSETGFNVKASKVRVRVRV